MAYSERIYNSHTTVHPSKPITWNSILFNFYTLASSYHLQMWIHWSVHTNVPLASISLMLMVSVIRSSSWPFVTFTQTGNGRSSSLTLYTDCSKPRVTWGRLKRPVSVFACVYECGGGRGSVCVCERVSEWVCVILRFLFFQCWCKRTNALAIQVFNIYNTCHVDI